MQPVLLIYGYSTSGKTELGKQLVANGHYHIAIELDHIAKWLGKSDHLPSKEQKFSDMFSDPDIEKMTIAAKIINKIMTAETKCVVTGIWPNEDRHFFSLLQRPYQIVIIAPPADISTVRERWVRRSGIEKWKAHAAQFTQNISIQ